MNVVGVADTHAALWYLLGDSRLSATARNFINDAERARWKIAISAISLVEIVYLEERSRLVAGAYGVVVRSIADLEQVFVEAPVNSEIADAVRRVSRAQIPDMPDRIVAATGLQFKVPVITCDGKIQASDIETLW